MGKATIINNLGSAQYEIDYIYDISNITARLTELAARILELGNNITAAQAKVNSEQAALDSLISDQNAAINSQDIEQATSIAKDIAKQSAELAKANNSLNNLKIDKHSAEKEEASLQANVVEKERMTVWCADFSDGLTGDVGTIEIDGDPDKGVLIFPNGCAEIYTAYNGTLHGIVNAPMNVTPANMYFNRALFPAWQKFKPTYRIGTITGWNGILCNIALDAAASREQNLNINQSNTLIDVPIDYLCCDDKAFSIGDQVVIQFTNNDWSNPTVIGFKDNPILCDQMLIAQDYDNNFLSLRYINGTWRASNYTVEADDLRRPTNWRGRYVNGEPTINLGWTGENGRHFHVERDGFYGYGNTYLPGRSQGISRDGKNFALAPADVLGAAIQDVNGVDYLYAICIDYSVHRVQADSPDRFDDTLWESLGTLNITARAHDRSSEWRHSFFFNGDGTEAVSVQWSTLYNTIQQQQNPFRQCYRYKVDIVDTTVTLTELPVQEYTVGSGTASGSCTFAMDYIDDVLVEATADYDYVSNSSVRTALLTINVPGTASFNLLDIGNPVEHNSFMFYLDLRYGVVLRCDTGRYPNGDVRPSQLILQTGNTSVSKEVVNEYGDYIMMANALYGKTFSSSPMNTGIMMAHDLPNVQAFYWVAGAVTRDGAAAMYWEPMYYQNDPPATILSHSNQNFGDINPQSSNFMKIAWPVV